ncbi:hypothetical protein [Pelagerythrobacter sp.]|uniref:hypothetical protein n=1 Tax=Pelagerythrobacter sp. TaxID=2800702 RepID=UPI0035B4B2DC
MRLINRIAALEAKSAVNDKPWKQVIVEEGHSPDDVISDYLERNDLSEDDVNIIAYVIVSPPVTIAA